MSNTNTEFASAKYTAGQLNALVKVIRKQIGENGVEYLLNGRAEVVMKFRFTPPITITIPADMKPKRLRDMDGVWLSDNAMEFFGEGEKLAPVKERSITYRHFTQPLNDFEIIEELGEQIVFDSPEELEPTIAQLLAKQPSGEEGDLGHDGKANIFYVRNPKNQGEILWVNVSWRAGDAGWIVRANQRAVRRWSAGSRVFCNC